ncbi:MAG TPA: CBS domain-containing protein [Gemmatimonadales bacterium]|nr:CBS domain-containing protein [Gemmatimonadales bacterium]
MLSVRDLMSTDVVAVSPELSIRDALELLTERHIGGAPVMTDGRVVGVVTAADLLAFEAGTAPAPVEREDQLEVGELAPTLEELEDEETVPPSAFFTEWWTDAGADVVERGRSVAQPEWDVLAERTVAEAMSTSLLWVAPQEPVARAAALMGSREVHRLLVLERGRLVGILTTTDIARAVADGRLSDPTAAPRGGRLRVPAGRVND